MPYTDCMDETSYKSNRNVFSAGHYHVVWCPKYRRKVLEPPIDERLKQLMSEICEEHDAEIEELDVQEARDMNGTVRFDGATVTIARKGAFRMPAGSPRWCRSGPPTRCCTGSRGRRGRC